MVRGIFDAMEELKEERTKAKCAKLMADGYNIPASDTINMFGDAHSTNWAENFQFFLNQNNPTNFERVWTQAYYLYRRIGSINASAGAVRQGDGFLDDREAGQGGQVPLAEGRVRSTPGAQSGCANSCRVGRDPHQHDRHPVLPEQLGDLTRRSIAKIDGKAVEELYDPNVDNVLEEVAKLAGQFGAARIIVEGHTDSSRRGQIPEAMVKELSLNRANCGARGAGEQVQDRSQSLRRRRHGLGGRPIRTIRTTRPRTAAWKSRSTRPRNSNRWIDLR